jgi:hypothetical protein
MSLRVKLSDIIDALEMLSDMRFAYLHRSTGKLVMLTDDEMRAAEDDDDTSDRPEWERETIQEAKEVLTSSDYLELPTSFEIHEYSIMDDFCFSVSDNDLRDELLGAISGRGAFRCFRETIERRGITDAWYRYQGEAYAEIAVRWLEANGIEYERGEEPSNGTPPN